jgi:hypothetical protein
MSRCFFVSCRIVRFALSGAIWIRGFPHSSHVVVERIRGKVVGSVLAHERPAGPAQRINILISYRGVCLVLFSLRFAVDLPPRR